MSNFDTSDHGLMQAGVAPVFDRLSGETAEGNWYCVVDVSTDGDSTFGTGCETESGNAPANGDTISPGGTFGRFTKLVITGTVFAYRMP